MTAIPGKTCNMTEGIEDRDSQRLPCLAVHVFRRRQNPETSLSGSDRMPGRSMEIVDGPS